MARELRRRIDPLLPRDERVVWAAQPKPGRFLRESVPFFVFAIPWTAFALFWEGMVLFTGGPFAMRLMMGVFGLPFVGIGIWMMSRPIRTLKRVRETAYAVTTERAVLVDLKAETVQGYPPDAFTEIHRPRPTDLVFTSDRRRESFFPSPTLTVNKSLYLPIGFAGVEEIDDAEAHLRELLTEKRARHEEPPGNPTRARRTDEAATVVTANGTFEAFLVKLRANVRDQQQRLAARHRRAWTIYQTVLGLIGVLVAAGLFNLAQQEPLSQVLPAGLFAVFFVGIFAFVVGFVIKLKQKSEQDEVERDDAFREVLAALQPDVHPKSPLLGFADLGEADAVRPLRTRKSPHSGAIKTYHKHHWGQLFWAFADGTRLALNLVDKVKYKGGAEVKRSHHVRGRLSLDASRYEADVPPSFESSRLQVLAVEQDGRLQLCFTGELTSVAELPGELHRLYRQLDPAAATTPI